MHRKMAAGTPRKGALVTKLLKNDKGQAVPNNKNVTVVIPKGQTVSLADLEAQVRRENGQISSNNVVIVTSDSEPCATDSKYGDKLNFIMKKLDKLDLLDTLTKELGELKTSVEFCHGSIEDIKKENISLQKTTVKLRDEIAQLRSERGTDHDRLLDTEWRSMRDNLLFHGVPKDKDERSAESTLREFMTKEMKINGGKYDFSRVHRMGARKPGKPRVIVTKFERFKDREEVKFSAKALAGTHFGVNE